MTDDSTPFDPVRLQRAIFQLCRSWQDAGVEQVPRGAGRDFTFWETCAEAETPEVLSDDAPTADSTNVPHELNVENVEPNSSSTPSLQPAPSAIQQEGLFDETPSAMPVFTLDERQEKMEALRQQVAQCVRCEELACTRTQTVFGVGSLQPRLCFFGEAPGADEDRQGEPFVGAAGQLLNRIIAACTLRREDVYILNVLKCRPPGNRTPVVDEVANCRPFFEEQLEILQPEFICCLGAAAAQALLQTTQSVGRMRKRFHDYGSAKVLVTYHPAYLLRNPNAKRDVWDDMKMLMREMGNGDA